MVDTDYKVNIEDIQMYIARVDTSRMDSGKYLLDLKNTRLLQDNVTPDLTTNSFNVSPSTRAISFCFSDSRRGTDTRISPSEFKVFNNALTANNLELALSRFFFEFRGEKYPPIDVTPEFNDEKDYLVQLFLDHSMATNMYEDRMSAGENYADWKSMHFPVSSDGSSTDTRLQVSTEFRQAGTPSAAGATSIRLLVFDTYSSVAQVTISEGRVANITVQSV